MVQHVAKDISGLNNDSMIRMNFIYYCYYIINFSIFETSLLFALRIYDPLKPIRRRAEHCAETKMPCQFPELNKE